MHKYSLKDFMKLRFGSIIVLGALLLTACNFSLAADITPPPNYVSPTPLPTLGALYPTTASDLQNGAAIYVQHCAACHGDKGMGDGPQSMQLPVSVPPLGLREVAQAASPAQWYSIVSQGNLDRFMPPFVGALSDQERWDVVGYVLTLHTTADQIAEGRSLLEANCADCANKFKDQQKMAGLSESDLINIIKNGSSDIPAFGKNFTDSEAAAAAAYIRTLTFAAASGSVSTPMAVSAPTQALAIVNATQASAVVTPGVPGLGTVSGSLQLASGALSSTSLTITLHGYDPGSGQSSTPQEVFTRTAISASDGTFKFDNVAMPANRTFLADVSFGGIKYQSAFGTVPAGNNLLALTPIKLYDSTSDFKTLIFNQIHLYADFSTAGTVQVLEIYTFTNSTNKAVIISMDGSTIPFIKLPEGAQNAGYQADQSGSQFVAADKGVAVVPSDKTYSIIAFFNLPYTGQVELKQPFVVDAPSVVLLIPDGMNVAGPQLTSLGVQSIQNVNYQELQASDLKAGDVLTFTVSGSPPQGSTSSTTTAPNSSQALFFAGGSLGLLMIAAGAFLFMRDRRRLPEKESESEFESTDEVLDAMLALDDLHRGGKISDQAYHKRRTELKENLKDLV
jgi:mono/diheme cytochrome c family protein